MSGAQGPKTVKGAQSDLNYVSKLLLDCVPVFHKIITPAYILYRSGPVAIYYSEIYSLYYGSGHTVTSSLTSSPVANVCRGPKNYSYATARERCWSIIARILQHVYLAPFRERGHWSDVIVSHSLSSRICSSGRLILMITKKWFSGTLSAQVNNMCFFQTV